MAQYRSLISGYLALKSHSLIVCCPLPTRIMAAPYDTQRRPSRKSLSAVRSLAYRAKGDISHADADSAEATRLDPTLK